MRGHQQLSLAAAIIVAAALGYGVEAHRDSSSLGDGRTQTTEGASAADPTGASGGDAAAIADLRRQNARLTAEVDADRHRRATEDRLGIRVRGSAKHFTDLAGGGLVSGDAVDRQRLVELLPVVLSELDRYPPAAVGSMGLHDVILCTRLSQWGMREGGVAACATGTIYLAADVYNNSPLQYREMVNHEMFHLIDYATSGRLNTDDPEWTAANPIGFKYGGAGSAASTQNGSSELRWDTPGFLTTYSESAIKEDKAEVFGWLMADPAGVAARVAIDRTIGRKVYRIRAIVGDLNPKMRDVVPAPAS